MNANVRGSTKLLTENLGVRVLKKEHLAQLIKGLTMEGVNIVDYFPYGIPEGPDGVRGTLYVKPKAFGSLTEQLWTIPGIQWKKLEVFPYGIVAPEFLIVNFDSVAGFG